MHQESHSGNQNLWRPGVKLTFILVCLSFLSPAKSAAKLTWPGAPGRLTRAAGLPPLVGETGPFHSCKQVAVPGANDGSLMEIDIFGKRRPSCRRATRNIRLAVARIPEGAWGQIGSWNCIWSVPEVYCGHRAAKIFAANPGD